MISSCVLKSPLLISLVRDDAYISYSSTYLSATRILQSEPLKEWMNTCQLELAFQSYSVLRLAIS